jgi:heme/copper-type cytochrome/quinol oxidase subunit 4
VVLSAVVAVTLVMVGSSYLPMPSRAVSIAVILVAAAINAALVAGYLMHIITEKRMIWAVLAFTLVFFIGLMGLTIWSNQDIPTTLR